MSPPTLALMAAETVVDGSSSWLTWGNAGPAAFALIVFVFVISGKLQPRSNLERQERETAYWREAHKASESARVAQSEQLRDLLDGSRTVLDLLRAMQSAAPRQRDPR
jgi:hypothetical protein